MPTAKKKKFLDELIYIYRVEVNALYGIDASWGQLKSAAQNICADDFDKALIARETLLEEINELKRNDEDPEIYEEQLKGLDDVLLNSATILKKLYAFDIYTYLNITPPKLLK